MAFGDSYRVNTYFTQCVRAGLLVCKLHVYQRLSKYKIKSGIKSTVYIH